MEVTFDSNLKNPHFISELIKTIRFFPLKPLIVPRTSAKGSYDFALPESPRCLTLSVALVIIQESLFTENYKLDNSKTLNKFMNIRKCL